jgi:hypothetical protein
LLKIRIQAEPFAPEVATRIKDAIRSQYGFTHGEEQYLFIEAKVKNHAYNSLKGHINLLYKDGHTSDISQAADQMTIKALSEPVERHFVCFPREFKQLL